MSELLPCPFCGGSAEIVQIGNEATAKRGFQVKCLTWGCATTKRAMVIRQPLERAREFAAKAWNTRPAKNDLSGGTAEPTIPLTVQAEPSSPLPNSKPDAETEAAS